MNRLDCVQCPLRNIDVNGTDESIIRLDDFLKRSGLVGTGGEAKLRIQSGEVRVNGEVETRRRKQLASGDVVELLGERLVVADLDDQRGPDFDGFDG